MPWYKPTVRNDWGSETVYIGPIPKSSRGTYAGGVPLPPCVAAGRYRVRWPDGTEEHAEVLLRPEKRIVSDMGHGYDVVNNVPYFVYDHRGVRSYTRVSDSGAEFWLDVALPELPKITYHVRFQRRDKTLSPEAEVPGQEIERLERAHGGSPVWISLPPKGARIRAKIKTNSSSPSADGSSVRYTFGVEVEAKIAEVYAVPDQVGGYNPVAHVRDGWW